MIATVMPRANTPLWRVIGLSGLLLSACGGDSPKTATPEAEASHSADVSVAIEKLLAPTVEGGWLVGAAVAVVRKDDRVVRGYGTLTVGGRQVDGDTVFEIGSVSKVFTSLLLADAVVGGRLELDASASSVFPPNASLPSGVSFTLGQLASHTSGLPRMPSNFSPANSSDPYVDYGPDRLFEFLGSVELARAPGSGYEYSNLGAGLLGVLVARSADTSYSALLHERITSPLKLSDTSLSTPSTAKTRMAHGHDADGNKVAAWNFSALAGAGGIRSTANDMAKFVQAQLSRDHVLAEAMKLTQQRHFEISEEMGAIGLAWHITPDGRWLWHNGQTGGFASYTAIDLEHQLAVVVLANSSVRIVDQIGVALQHIAAGEDYQLELPKTVAVKPERLQRYVGRYQLTPEMVIEITRDGDSLWAQATGQPKFRLWATSMTTFYLRVVEARVDFVLDGDRASKLVLDQGGQSTEAPRLP